MSSGEDPEALPSNAIEPQTTLDLGGIIYSTFGGGSPAMTEASGQAFTILNPSAIAIDGTTLSAGQAGIIISQETLSLALPGGLIVDGESTQALGDGKASTIGGNSLPVVTDASGQVITILNPSAIAVDGTTLSVGQVGLTASGEVFSLASSLRLVVGGESITGAQASSSVLSGGLPFTSNVTASVFNGAQGRVETLSGLNVLFLLMGTIDC